EGAHQKGERFDADVFGLEIVRRLDIEAQGDLVPVDELDDVDRPGGLEGKLFQVLILDDHELVLAHLVATKDLAEGDHVLVGWAVPLLLDGSLTVRAELPEGDGAMGLGRQIHPDRDGHHPEADRAPPHGPGQSIRLQLGKSPDYSSYWRTGPAR